MPFSQLVPALVIMPHALAYVEEDGFALLHALLAALCSLAMTGLTVWGRGGNGSIRHRPGNAVARYGVTSTSTDMP